MRSSAVVGNNATGTVDFDRKCSPDPEDKRSCPSPYCARGGGIANLGVLIDEGSLIRGNWALWAGGGVANTGRLEMRGSRIESNKQWVPSSTVDEGTAATDWTVNGGSHGGGLCAATPPPASF